MSFRETRAWHDFRRRRHIARMNEELQSRLQLKDGQQR